MQQPLVVATGSSCIDYLAHVAAFPQPDDKMRTTKLFTSPGGNALQGLVCLSRLGVAGRLITKLGNDEIGRQIVDTLRLERSIDTSRVAISPGNSPFSYIIVDETTHTRTILHTPASLLTPDEIDPSFLDGATLLLNDGRQTHAGIRLTEMAIERGVPVLTDFDEDLDQAEKLIALSDYLLLNSDHLLKRTGETDLLAGMAKLLKSLPRARWVIATLGSQGSLLMRRPHAHSAATSSAGEEKAKNEREVALGDEYEEEEGKGEVADMSRLLARVPKYEDIAAKWQRMWAFGNAAACEDRKADEEEEDEKKKDEEEEREGETAIGLLVPTFCYRPTGADVHAQVHYCPAYPLNPASIVDTTGAGDVFVGGVCYGLARGLSLGQLLALASLVAAHKCMGSGLEGIPQRKTLPTLLLRAPQNQG